MSPLTTRCLLVALAIAGLGLALRAGLSVAPVDAPFRGVLRAYATPGATPDRPAAAPSNTAETSSP